VQIERCVELFHCRPEREVLWRVVVHKSLSIADLRIPIDQGAAKIEFGNATRELGGCEVGVLHGQRREGCKSERMSNDRFGEMVVGALRHHGVAARGRGCLDRRRIERKDHHLDAMTIHFGRAQFRHVDEALAQLRPGAVRQIPFRIEKRVFGGKVSSPWVSCRPPSPRLKASWEAARCSRSAASGAGASMRTT
jgi:hypothetical protein